VPVEQRKHLRMDDAGSSRQPRNRPHAKTRCRAERIGVVDVAVANDRDRFEATVRMLWKTGYHVAVIHPPAVLAFEVLSDVVTCERCGGTELFVALGIVVDVRAAKQKRVPRLPSAAQRRLLNNRISHTLTLPQNGQAVCVRLASPSWRASRSTSPFPRRAFADGLSEAWHSRRGFARALLPCASWPCSGVVCHDPARLAVRLPPPSKRSEER